LMSLESALLYVVWILEVILILAHVIVTFVYERTLVKKKVLHPNLQLLLMLSPAPLIVYQATLYLHWILDQFVKVSDDMDKWLGVVMDTGLFGTAFNLFGFVFERLIATLLVRRYEFISARIPFISLSVIAVQWAMAVAFIAAYYADWITLLPNLIVVGVEWAISVVMFSALPTISRRSYDRAMRNSTLRYRNRYQSIENIRTALVRVTMIAFL
ncbi:hypothetical protein PFISCL1PPCAC_7422, partial [Pristionchus fissidentatus]